MQLMSALMSKNENYETENEPLVETVDFNNPSFIFVPKETHNWRQKGFFIECRSCDITHAVYIGPEKLLVGIEKDGTPLFKNR